MTTSTMTMEILRDSGPYRHLRFQDGLSRWELHTFPGGLMIRGFGDYVLVNGAEDVLESMAFTQGDPTYWSEKLTSGSPLIWSEATFREHLEEDADQEVLDFLEMHDLCSEALAREAVATADIEGLEFPYDVDEFYVLSPRFTTAIARAHEGLTFYQQH